jgi:hypothetical protein
MKKIKRHKLLLICSYSIQGTLWDAESHFDIQMAQSSLVSYDQWTDYLLSLVVTNDGCI